MIIESYDHTNITFNVCKEVGRIEIEACKNDLSLQSFFKPEERFSDDYLPSIADYEQLKARINFFESFILYGARLRYHSLKSNPRLKLFMAKDQDRYVGIALWILPKYLQLPKLSLLQRLKNYLLAKYFRLLNFLDYLRGFRNPMLSSGILQEYSDQDQKLGLTESDGRLDELQNFSQKQREETYYPQDYTYFLHLLFVRPHAQRRGCGTKLIEESMKALAPYVSPPTLGAPAKAALLSSPTAINYYPRKGYRVGSSNDSVLPNNQTVTNIYFYKNLPSEDEVKYSE